MVRWILALCAFGAATSVARASEALDPDVCSDLPELSEVFFDDLIEASGDCVPAIADELACEEATDGDVAYCDAPYGLGIRRPGAHAKTAHIQGAPVGHRPVRGTVADDGANVRDGGSGAPTTQPDLSAPRDLAVATAPAPAAPPVRVAFTTDATAPLAAGHARRLDRPPRA